MRAVTFKLSKYLINMDLSTVTILWKTVIGIFPNYFPTDWIIICT